MMGDRAMFSMFSLASPSTENLILAAFFETSASRFPVLLFFGIAKEFREWGKSLMSGSISEYQATGALLELTFILG